jgi:sugar lactone lactonase YvrE
MPSEYENSPETTQVECIVDYSCEIGENPLWHPREKRLYWCDIPNGRIFRYHPASGIHEKYYEGRTVGGFTFQIDGSLLLFMDRGTIATWHHGELTEVVPEIEAERCSRFNDVIADPRGRVFCGTMSSDEKKGSLYRLDLDGSLHVVLKDIGCSNGMAFTRDQKSFYHTDSFAREIYIFDYKVENGTVSNQRVFARIAESEGLPDGATLDAEGHLWSALWDGACLVRFLPDGRTEKKISLPARKTSSLTFGGEDYRDIYVTTAGGKTRQEDGQQAGALFRLKTQAQGVPEFFSRVLLTRKSGLDIPVKQDK